MRRLFLVLTTLLLSVTVLFAQKKGEEIPVPELPIDEDTQLVTYKEVVNEQGTPQVLYDRALAWAKKYYNNKSEVFKVTDRENGILEIRSSVRIYTILKDGSRHFKNVVYYNMKIECRENRYRYTITDFKEKATSSAPIEAWFNTEAPKWEPAWYLWLNQINEDMEKLTNNLLDEMLPKEEKNDDW